MHADGLKIPGKINSLFFQIDEVFNEEERPMER
jgi:hypothetical protein